MFRNANSPIYLGVNVDHVATLRQMRGTAYPDPVEAALAAERAGADAITVHLREDRRHIQERDLNLLKAILKVRLNLEMAVSDDMMKIALGLKPSDCCLVPEKRQELTTEGGLDVIANKTQLHQACTQLAANGIRVSLFIDPDVDQIQAAHDVKAPVIELHTGAYANASGEQEKLACLLKLEQATLLARKLGIQVNAGHGLHYHNVEQVAHILEIREFNIGHAIVARAIFDGIGTAVRDMKVLLKETRLRALIMKANQNGAVTDVIQST